MKKIFEFESAEIFNPVNQQGKRYALETFKDWFLESNGYTLKGSAGMGSIKAQNALIHGEAAMMLNGSWFRNEMKSYVGDTNLGIFKVPEKSIDGVVQHRDNKGTYNVVHSEYAASYIIPSKAKNVDDAVEFLKFISRPDMCELYTKTVDCIRPFKYNKDSSSDTYKDMNSFGKSVLDIANNNQLYAPVSKNPLAIRGQISYWPLNEDTYHTKRLLTEGRTVDYCLKREYDHAKTIL
jgi:ABC-type glycerol-3-phosphate transport system substrate-binding protein